MCSELFRSPYEVGGVPIFGVGVLLVVWAIVSAATIVGLIRKHGSASEIVGALPVLLLSAGLTSPAQALLLLVVYLGLQVTQAVLWRMWLQPRSLYVGPAVIAVIGLLGYDLYGLGGLLFGTVIGIFLIALADAAAGTVFLSGIRQPVTPEGEPAAPPS